MLGGCSGVWGEYWDKWLAQVTALPSAGLSAEAPPSLRVGLTQVEGHLGSAIGIDLGDGATAYLCESHAGLWVSAASLGVDGGTPPAEARVKLGPPKAWPRALSGLCHHHPPFPHSPLQEHG